MLVRSTTYVGLPRRVGDGIRLSVSLFIASTDRDIERFDQVSALCALRNVLSAGGLAETSRPCVKACVPCCVRGITMRDDAE